jgi:hypothetical protein
MSDLKDIQVRMEKLERDNLQMARRTRHLKSMVGLLALALTAVIGSGARFDQNLRELDVERLVIRDKEGVARFTLGIDPDGSGSLTLRDKQNQARLRLLVQPDGYAGLQLHDSKGHQRFDYFTNGDGSHGGIGYQTQKGLDQLHIGVTDNGFLGIMARADDGTNRLGLGIFPDGSTHALLGGPRKEAINLAVTPGGFTGLSLNGENGKPAIRLGTVPQGSTNLTMHDLMGRKRLSLGSVPKGDTGISCWGEDQRSSLGMTILQDGNAAFGVNDANGQTRAAMGFIGAANESYVILNDANGNSAFSAAGNKKQ